MNPSQIYVHSFIDSIITNNIKPFILSLSVDCYFFNVQIRVNNPFNQMETKAEPVKSMKLLKLNNKISILLIFIMLALTFCHYRFLFNVYLFLITTSNLAFCISSVISLYWFVQMDLRRMGVLYQNLRQPGISDPDCSLCAVSPRQHQPLRSQQILQWREAGEPEAL